MKTKKDKFEPVGAERMTDAELSKQLGSYQRAESIGMLLGVLLVIAGCIMMFVYRNIAVICILAFAGVAFFLLVAKPAQTKKKTLMQQQLGGFFRTEEGATDFLKIMSYTGTAKKQGVNPFHAILLALSGQARACW